ncbi:MAG: hypothetical protein II970_00685 [Paludibacteraceae bacterium]|nr:hypothetical protein [Paludibacteraceae bacterium]
MQRNYRYMIDSSELHRLGLCGSDALVYSALASLCHKNGRWQVNYSFLAGFSCVGDKTTAWRIVKKLAGQGLLAVETKDGNSYVSIIRKPLQNATESLQNATEPLQNATEPLQNATNTPYIKKISSNINNIQKGGGVKGSTTTGTTTSFSENPASGLQPPAFGQWWQLYAGETLWHGLKIQTEKEWNTLTPDEQRQVFSHSQLFAPANRKRKSPKLPNWYLIDRTWLQPLDNMYTPVFLSGIEQDECRKLAVPLVQVRAPDGTYRIMRKSDAEQCRMQITRDW